MNEMIPDGPAVPQARPDGAAVSHTVWTPVGEVARPQHGSAVDESAVIDAIGTVYDPEIPVNIYELGLIYAIELGEGGKVRWK